MKILIRLLIPLMLCILIPVQGMKKIKIPNMKKNIVKSNYLKPTVSTEAYKTVGQKKYSSFVGEKFNKSVKPLIKIPLLNKNISHNKSLNEAYREYSTADKSTYAGARRELAKQVLIRRKIREKMAPFRYRTIFGDALIEDIVEEAKTMKNPLEIDRFVRTELNNLYDSSSNKILNERVIQRTFANDDFHWLFNPIKSVKVGVSQHNIKKFYDESVREAIQSWKEQMRDDRAYREKFIAETKKQITAARTNVFKRFAGFWTRGNTFISDQTEKEFERNIKEIIIDEQNNPQEADKIVSGIVEEWLKEKPLLRKNPKNGFFESYDPKRRNKRDQKSKQTSRIEKYWWVPSVILTWLWITDEDEMVSKKPFGSTQVPAAYQEELYIYGLDGEMASTMDPDAFVHELHAKGLTVADAVKIQCQIQEEDSYKDLTVAANLSDHDWNLLQNIFKLRHDFLQGHYNENNVVFEGIFDKSVMDMVKTALQKADVPFKVKVHNNPEGKKENVLGSAGVREQTKLFTIGDKVKISYVPEAALTFKYHLATGTAGTVGKNVVSEIYLSPELLSLSNEEIKVTIAHEVTHVANLHHLQSIFFHKYVTKVKGSLIPTYYACQKILSTIHEYQADVLPLADPEYAKAYEFEFKSALGHDSRPDIYVTTEKGYELASRAMKLHKAEKRIKESKNL